MFFPNPNHLTIKKVLLMLDHYKKNSQMKVIMEKEFKGYANQMIKYAKEKETDMYCIAYPVI